MFGKRCLLCGLYIKFFQRSTHERWHAEQVVYILSHLCGHCAKEHGKSHTVCGKPACKCPCSPDSDEE